MSALTPGAFAEEMARRFGPPPNPDNPFSPRTEIAKQRLCLQATREVLGEKHPLSQFLKAYEIADIYTWPSNRSPADAETVDSCIEDMRSAFETIEQDFLKEAEAFRE